VQGHVQAGQQLPWHWRGQCIVARCGAADMSLIERDRMRVRVGAGTWKQAARPDQAAAAARRRSARQHCAVPPMRTPSHSLVPDARRPYALDGATCVAPPRMSASRRASTVTATVARAHLFLPRYSMSIHSTGTQFACATLIASAKNVFSHDFFPPLLHIFICRLFWYSRYSARSRRKSESRGHC
jgi:hypothetical protein